LALIDKGAQWYNGKEFVYFPGMCTRPSEPRPRRSKFCPRRDV